MELFLGLWLLTGVAAAIVMHNKGRSGCGGFALGFLLGPLGLVVALVLSEDHREVEHKALQTSKYRKCPHCAEPIRPEARTCRFCGSDVVPLR